MTEYPASPGHNATSARRRLALAAASCAVVLLTACSSPAPEGSATTSAPASVSASASASSTASATASPTPTVAPSAVSAVKELVAGFPAGVLPLMTGAQVQSSSIEHAEPVSVASLTATVTATSADVLAYYTGVFTAEGFTAQPGDSVDGVPIKTFVRAEGQEVVTVSIVQTAATATFTLGATLLPASFK